MEYRKRKHPRLKQYDYSLPGYYYVTVHMTENAPSLSSIIPKAFPERACVQLSATGSIIETQLLALESRFEHLSVDKYVIMPTHIHMILCLTDEAAGASPRPMLSGIVGAFKSLSTRICNAYANTPGRKLFQTSFYETVLRNEKTYQECWRYIDENPEKWILDPEDM